MIFICRLVAVDTNGDDLCKGRERSIYCATPGINLYRANAARSVGGNARRMSHNPPDPSMLDIYDRVGMVVMDENREFQVGEEYYHNQRDMVQRDRNHPSVV